MPSYIMHIDIIPEADTPPALALTRLMDRHGTRAVLRALICALIRRRAARHDAALLSDHMRRDIGLPERGEPPPSPRGPLP